jgi:hypothetical protein
VEYKDASHSEQIRAGMDIIHAFQKSAETYVPVFVDNAEACTYLRQMDCQVIKLIVYVAPKPELPLMEDSFEAEADAMVKYQAELKEWEANKKKIRIERGN